MGAPDFNRRFARYDEDLASLDAEGGSHFPRRRPFLACQAGFLEAREIVPTCPDRGRIERKVAAMGYGGRS